MIKYDAFRSHAAGHMQESAIRRMGTVLAHNRDIISFAPGYPAPDTFPWADFQEISHELLSGADGSASFPGLSLTGTYSVLVSKQGFGDESRGNITLRSSETATLRVKLLVGQEKSEVTVIGTKQGVRADSQIGVTLDSQTIDEQPILGRKITTLPLFNSAFRQGKGTGDLFS